MAEYNVGYIYHIRQWKEPFANMKMKNGKSVSSSGCAVCAFAMLIGHKEGYGESDAVQVVTDLIEECTDSNAYITNTFSNKTINGKQYSSIEVSDMAAQIQKGIPVVVRLAKNGSAVHYVTVVGLDTSKSGMEAYIILDPGKDSNYTLQDALNYNAGSAVAGKYIIN